MKFLGDFRRFEVLKNQKSRINITIKLSLIVILLLRVVVIINYVELIKLYNIFFITVITLTVIIIT
ncbi:hypothetical protein SAMN06264346_10663 [Chryseobacterium profundimaris]|uniref:Uncharacterized protein n=1 Tax=Chryseobacterium profundimaris TaxID=1387275 RepID=A0ABY1NZT6_9FLAO|nr:hypothetical protein SAMN06264346_10663 [Chryseobacterium profundimaris]